MQGVTFLDEGKLDMSCLVVCHVAQNVTTLQKKATKEKLFPVFGQLACNEGWKGPKTSNPVLLPSWRNYGCVLESSLNIHAETGCALVVLHRVYLLPFAFGGDSSDNREPF